MLTSRFVNLDFDDFTYNPETKAYEAENVAGLGLSNENLVRIFFENQKLKEINVVVGSVNNTITFDYSDQTIVIPTKMVTFNEWKTALDFNYENYQVAMQQTVSGVESESEFKKFGNIKYVNGVAGLHQYATIENGKYYIYNESSGTWTKQEVLEPEYTEISVTATLAVFADGANFAKFTYNTEREAYEAENLVVGETTFAKIKLYFFTIVNVLI